jgi:hypothetical protein
MNEGLEERTRVLCGRWALPLARYQTPEQRGLSELKVAKS